MHGIVTIYSIYICDSYNRTITNSVIYGCKALLQVMALIFAFSIRKVNIKGLDDSPFIIAAIYVSSIVLAVILVSFITLKDFENVFAVVYCTGFFIGATAMLLLIFVPKVLSHTTRDLINTSNARLANHFSKICTKCFKKWPNL